MDVKRLVLLSFGAKCLIIMFFGVLIWAHTIFCRKLLNRTTPLSDIKLELKKGADINMRSKSADDLLRGSTPLMIAVKFGLVDRVEYLLNFKLEGSPSVDVNLQADNKQGDTALHLAARNVIYPYSSPKPGMKILKMLLDNGAEVNKKNNWGNTPLIAALDVPQENRRRNVVRELIKRGALINTQNENGKTFLHIAIERGFGPTVRWFLCNYGKRVVFSLKNKDGDTIEMLAKRLKNEPVEQALQDGIKLIKRKAEGKKVACDKY